MHMMILPFLQTENFCFSSVILRYKVLPKMKKALFSHSMLKKKKKKLIVFKIWCLCNKTLEMFPSAGDYLFHLKA